MFPFLKTHFLIFTETVLIVAGLSGTIGYLGRISEELASDAFIQFPNPILPYVIYELVPW